MDKARTYISRIYPVRDMPTALGWTLRAHVSDPDPSPKCEREGHAWGTAKHNGIPDDGVTVQVCTPCARRGAYVFLTTQSAGAVARGRKRQAESDKREADQLRRRLAELDARLGTHV